MHAELTSCTSIIASTSCVKAAIYRRIRTIKFNLISGLKTQYKWRNWAVRASHSCTYGMKLCIYVNLNCRMVARKLQDELWNHCMRNLSQYWPCSFPYRICAINWLIYRRSGGPTYSLHAWHVRTSSVYTVWGENMLCICNHNLRKFGQVLENLCALISPRGKSYEEKHPKNELPDKTFTLLVNDTSPIDAVLGRKEAAITD